MVTITGSIDIEAPVRECYRYWTYFERFPEIVPYVKRVCYLRESDTWQWEFAGPKGETMTWNTVIGTVEPNRWLVLQSASGDNPDLRVTALFDEIENFWTRLTLSVTYHLPRESSEAWSRERTACLQHVADEGLRDFRHFMMKQPAAVKSQAGLSESGSMQGLDTAEFAKTPVPPGLKHPFREGDRCSIHPFEKTMRPAGSEWDTGIPKPDAPPGDIPSIGEEYTTFGVSKYTPKAEQESHILKGTSEHA